MRNLDDVDRVSPWCQRGALRSAQRAVELRARAQGEPLLSTADEDEHFHSAAHVCLFCGLCPQDYLILVTRSCLSTPSTCITQPLDVFTMVTLGEYL